MCASRHSLLGALEAVENQLAEEREANIAATGDAVLALAIDKEKLLAAVGCGDVDVFAQLDVALGAEDEQASVAPRSKASRREPIHAEVAGRAIVGDEVAFPEILQLRILWVRDIPRGGVDDLGVFGTREKKELFDLVAADVAQDAAVFFLLEKPIRP